MRTLLVAALAAAAAAGEPRPAVMPVRSLRGGQLAQPASAEPPAAPLTASPPAAEPDGGAALQAYLEAMGGFMERFSQLVDTATGTCKPNFFGMPPPSAAKIRTQMRTTVTSREPTKVTPSPPSTRTSAHCIP